MRGSGENKKTNFPCMKTSQVRQFLVIDLDLRSHALPLKDQFFSHILYPQDNIVFRFKGEKKQKQQMR